jgi:hypothetical protein
MDCFVALLLAMTADTDSHSRDTMRPSLMLIFHHPRNQRAQGMPGARCTRGLVCKKCAKKRTRAYRYRRNTPAFPAQWLYGLCRALPGDEFVLSPSSADRWRVRSGWTDLPPRTWHQQRVSGPHGFAVRVAPFILRASVRSRKPPCKHFSRPTLPRPPQPIPTFVTMANAPLLGTGCASHSDDLPDGESGKFFLIGLDTKMSDLPVRQL